MSMPVGVTCCGVLIALMLANLRLGRLPLPRQGATSIRGPVLIKA